jgi:hypothetical protein
MSNIHWDKVYNDSVSLNTANKFVFGKIWTHTKLLEWVFAKWNPTPRSNKRIKCLIIFCHNSCAKQTEIYVSGAVTENCHIMGALSSACLNIFTVRK